MAQSIIQLQQMFGPIPQIWGQGNVCKSIVTLMETLIKEDSIFESTQSAPIFTDLICMDRSVDMISVLLSQLNYSGLLDEEFGINSGEFILRNILTFTHNEE